LTKGSHGSSKKFKKKKLYDPSKVLYGHGSPNQFFFIKKIIKILHGPGGATLPYNPHAAASVKKKKKKKFDKCIKKNICIFSNREYPNSRSQLMSFPLDPF
jgi:hypothetical protein